MGCCGCDNRTSSLTAGILGLVQGIIGFILCCYFLNLFYGYDINTDTDKLYLVARLFQQISVVKGLLVTSIILEIVWIISSILLLVGNSTEKAPFVRQWVAVTVVVILHDVIYPAILLGTTAKVFSYYEFSNGAISGSTLSSADTLHNFAGNYLLLAGTFSRFGLISLGTNIALCIFTSRRAHEILHPPTGGYVIQAGPGYMVPAPQMVFVGHQSYGQPQQGYVQQQATYPQHQAYGQPLQGLGQQQPPPPPNYDAQPPSDGGKRGF